jgi:hypothetical protein
MAAVFLTLVVVLVDTRGPLNGCVEGVLYFSQVIGGEHLVVNIEAWNGNGSTSSRFDLFPSGTDQLSNCSVQTDSKSPLIRDPRYRWDTAAGLACAFIDPAAVGQATAPAAPGNPVATAITQNSVSMSWIDNSSNEDGFKVYRWDAPEPGWVVVGTVGANVTTFTATGLACNTRYYFNINAYNGYGETPAPSEGWLNITTSACDLPQPVTNCDGGEGVYLYEHDNFGGKCHKVTGDSASAASWSIGHDAASSIRFVGKWTARVYEHDNYQGVSSFFNQDDANFGDDKINHDRASSIRIYRTNATSDFKCEQLGTGFNAVVDGICVKYQSALISGVSGLNTVISVADLRNPNIRVELAHELEPNQTDLFRMKTTEEFVKQNSGLAQIDV